MNIKNLILGSAILFFAITSIAEAQTPANTYNSISSNDLVNVVFGNFNNIPYFIFILLFIIYMITLVSLHSNTMALIMTTIGASFLAVKITAAIPIAILLVEVSTIVIIAETITSRKDTGSIFNK